MAATAGQKIIAGRVSGERIATDVNTAPTGSITTTETAVASVTAPLVSGRTYRLTFSGRIRSSVSGDDITFRLREDSTTGTVLWEIDTDLEQASLNQPMRCEAEFTATTTADKTFIASMFRITGTGTLVEDAGANAPSYLYVDYIRG